MVLTIKNFESQSVGPGVTETAPTNLVGVAGTLKATLTWTSATGESGVIWSEEKLVRKEGSAPSNSLDGTTVATITTKDTYKTTGYEDTGLDSTKTYYYKVFAVYDNGTERGSNATDVTPTAPTFTGLCFTAQEANSGVALRKNGTPTPVELEISTDGTTWSDYTIGDAITLANVGDKVYMRNKSEAAGFYTDSSNYYRFSMTGKIGASGDVTSLMNKNGTTTLGRACYFGMFRGCTSLTTPPELPATTLDEYCYANMFNGCANLTTVPELLATTLAEHCYAGMFKDCTNLITVPELSATTLVTGCYQRMFNGCTSIKLSETQTGEYQIPYRIPTTGTGTDDYYTLDYMFANTGGTFKGTPTINTTYYLSNGSSTLLSYEQLRAIPLADDVLTELNTDPTGYYDKLTSEGHTAYMGTSGLGGPMYGIVSSGTTYAIWIDNGGNEVFFNYRDAGDGLERVMGI